MNLVCKNSTSSTLAHSNIYRRVSMLLYLGLILTVCCSEKNSEEKRVNMKSKVETERNHYNVADEKKTGTVCSI